MFKQFGYRDLSTCIRFATFLDQMCMSERRGKVFRLRTIWDKMSEGPNFHPFVGRLLCMVPNVLMKKIFKACRQ